jgi:hypothetical protein
LGASAFAATADVDAASPEAGLAVARRLGLAVATGERDARRDGQKEITHVRSPWWG